MIDLRSDTVTVPTDAMWTAMRAATLGDDTLEGDATVEALEREAATMLGKDAALFVCSGTMGNALATLVHAPRGGEAILDQAAHMAHSEGGGVSRLAGLFCRLVPSERGAMDLNILDELVRGSFSRYGEPTAMIGLETSHNGAGGCVPSLAYMADVAALAQARDVPVHIDGARLFNAAVALNVPVRELAQFGDSVTFCLSKGLSAPMGSLLLGSHAFIERAKTLRRTLGGGLRQAGIMAAAGRVALAEMVDRLADDHRHAQALWEGLAHHPLLQRDAVAPQTNIVRVRVPDAQASAWVTALAASGVQVRANGKMAMRLVTHRHIDAHAIAQAIDVFKGLQPA